MKLICNQQSLFKALNTVSKAVTARTTIPLLKGILLETSNGQLKISASDLDLSIEKKIHCTVLEEGSAVVSAKLFSDIIRRLPHEDVEIELKETNRLDVRCLSSDFTIIAQSSDEFPKIDEIKEEKRIRFDKEIIKNMIRKTSFSASIEESKGVIVGVLIEIEKGQLSMVALDGFRMAVTRTEMEGDLKLKIIIAARILNEIYKIISESEEADFIDLILDEKKAVFFIEDTLIVARLLEGDFIKYQEILPKEYESRIIVNKEELLESIERAALFARDGRNNLVKLSLYRDKIIITSRSEEGNVKEEVFMKKDGEDLEIGFNAKYISDALKAISDEEISMEFNSSISPCLIKQTEGNEYEYLILPVRIAADS